MNKKEFMRRLKLLLPKNDKRDILLDYEEHFLSGLNEGKTEEEIVSELGRPEEVAAEFGYAGKVPVTYSIWAGVGLVVFDLLIGISILATVFSVFISLWVIPITALVTGIVLIVASMVTVWFVTFPWYMLLLSGISLLGFAALTTVGMVYVSKAFYLGIKWYVMLHVKLFSGR